jgi:hypothetical protein
MDQPESETAEVKDGPKVIEPNASGKALNRLDPQQDEYSGCYH